MACSAPLRSVLAPDGARAELSGDALELRDTEDRLLVRYVGGTLEIVPARGDLRLAAPEGRVRIEAALDISFAAGRDVRLGAIRAVELETPSASSELRSCIAVEPGGVRITGRNVDARAHRVRLVGSAVDFIATTLRQNLVRLETTARTLEQTVERASTKIKEIVIGGSHDHES